MDKNVYSESELRATREEDTARLLAAKRERKASDLPRTQEGKTIKRPSSLYPK